MRIDPQLFGAIGPIIRAVSVAHSGRLFKSEKNTLERTAFVLAVVFAEISVALCDLGLTMQQVQEVNPTDIVVEVMQRDGYDFGGPNPTVIYRPDVYASPASEQHGPMTDTVALIPVPEKIQNN